MIKMYEGFKIMTQCTDRNLTDIQEYIKQLQQTSKSQKVGQLGHHSGHPEVSAPKLEQIGKQLDLANEGIQQKVDESELQH